MDYKGIFDDLFDMWRRATNESRYGSYLRAQRYLGFAHDCWLFQRDLLKRGLPRGMDT